MVISLSYAIINLLGCPNGEFRLCCLYSPLRSSLSLLSPLLPSLLSSSLSLSHTHAVSYSPSLLTVQFLLFLSRCLSVCERESNRSVRLIAREVHILIAARCV